jgi:chromosomal replication initiation ATPase DnaA
MTAACGKVSNVIPLAQKFDKARIHTRCMEIVAEVAERHWCTSAEMLGDGRQKYLSNARDEAIILIKRELGLSSIRIGLIFNKDHSTVLASMRRTRAREILRDEPIGGIPKDKKPV